MALVPSMSNSVQAILNEPLPTGPKDFKCAICYSITTQQGLGGINLGNYLIKQVVEQLQIQYPQLETFATLSPLPGFRKWLMHHQDQDSSIVAELGLGWKKVGFFFLFFLLKKMLTNKLENDRIPGPGTMEGTINEIMCTIYSFGETYRK